MLTYNTGITNTPPITPEMRKQALAGLMSQAPSTQYPGSFGDVYDANAMEFGHDILRDATRTNNAQMLNAQGAQQNTALSGARQLAELQQNLNNLSNQRQQMAMNYAQNMFGGMNGLLRGLFT